MNTIQVEEESAIIPLRRLNEWKQQERDFFSKMTDPKVYYGMTIFNRWQANESKVYFIPIESEVKRALDDYKLEQDYRYKEESMLRAKVEMLEREINRLRDKKWYQFWPASK